MSNKSSHSSKEKRPPKETIYPEDKDWANYTVNLHDGWADDVSLIYPKNSWKPDDDELTHFSLDKTSPLKDLELEEEVSAEENRKSRKKINNFSIFMIIWIMLLVLFLSILLLSFQDYLSRYEEAYQASKPDSTIKATVELFNSNDIDSIYSSITDLPVLNAFENDISLKIYIAHAIENAEISYKASDDFTFTEPKYLLSASGNTISNITLSNASSKVDDYGFSDWYVSIMTFDFKPDYQVVISIPKDYSLLINDIAVPMDYIIDTKSNSVTYMVNDFYAEPYVCVLDANGEMVTVYYDSNKKIYSL